MARKIRIDEKKQRNVADRAARLIRADFGRELEYGGAAAKQALMRAIAKRLPIPCGRPRNEMLDEIMRRRKPGRGYRQILGMVMPGFYLLPDAEQRCQIMWASGAIRKRKARQKAKSKDALTNAPKISGSIETPPSEDSMGHEDQDA